MLRWVTQMLQSQPLNLFIQEKCLEHLAGLWENSAVTFVSQASFERDIGNNLELRKKTIPIKNTRSINKSDMVYNNLCPKVEVDPETYEVKANGEILTCEPASELPMAQRYFLY